MIVKIIRPGKDPELTVDAESVSIAEFDTFEVHKGIMTVTVSEEER